MAVAVQYFSREICGLIMTDIFSKTVRKSHNLLSQEINGETVILDLNGEQYFGLGEVGTRLWQLIETEIPIESVCTTILGEFEVEIDQLKIDIEQHFQELLDAGLVVLSDTRTGPQPGLSGD